jgi:hypothetical protein
LIFSPSLNILLSCSKGLSNLSGCSVHL